MSRQSSRIRQAPRFATPPVHVCKQAASSIQIAPPKKRNLQSLLNGHFGAKGLDLFAYQEAGVRVAGLDNFMPRPGVAAVPGIAGDEYYSTAFRFVAEVLSPSNTRRLTGQKLQRYRDSAECLSVLIVDSRRIWAELHSRGEAWTAQTLDDPAAAITLPAFGFTCRLGELYRGTVLEPGRM